MKNTGLILTGGGARAAYQVGVLKAIVDLLDDKQTNPFPIICGTSAGAINAASLACGANHFSNAVEMLQNIWGNFHVEQVYRADVSGILQTGAHWLSALMAGWFVRTTPRSLLDNTPLALLLQKALDVRQIDRSLASGALKAICITASGYASGESVNFYQCRNPDDIIPWRRSQRVSCSCRITHKHLLASSAIPFIFPSVHLHREYFGDGSMRQTSPISPAIHLGAERILIIGASRINEPARRFDSDQYPSLAQIGGHALSSIFLDSLNADVERMQRVNHTLSLIPPDSPIRTVSKLRPIQPLIIAPTERLDSIAAQHAHHLPPAMRLLLGGIGGTQKTGSALVSYLLFEPAYTQALIDLGIKDTLARKEEVLAFLHGEDMSRWNTGG